MQAFDDSRALYGYFTVVDIGWEDEFKIRMPWGYNVYI
jgi:hypothetical protein